MTRNAWSPVMVLLWGMFLQPGSGSAETTPVTDRASFQVEVETDVENDWLIAVLNVTAEDKAPAVVAEEINSTMDWALRQVRNRDKIKVRSGSYQTYPVYDDRKIVRWRGRQELYLESTAIEELSGLLGDLQSRLQMQSLQFSVSPQVRARVEEQLVEQVLAAWQTRAEVIARALGSKGYELIDVAIHSGAGGPVIPVRAEAMSMKSSVAVSAPALESGTSRVTAQASGSIRLLRDQ